MKQTEPKKTYRLKKTKVEESVVNAYKKMEEGIVRGYAAVERTFVDGYQRIEDKFVEKFLEEKEDENRRQTESSQACLNCRGAKEEKPVNQD